MSNTNKINGRDYKTKRLNNKKHTIVHKKTGDRFTASNGKKIGEFDNINNISGFLREESNYCIVWNNYKCAILDIINNKIITDWYDWINEKGFIESEYSYCILKKNGKQAILDVKNNKIITDWFDYSFSWFGFVEGKSNYCIVRHDYKCAIFDVINNKVITDWYNHIFAEGFVHGDAQYSIVKKGKEFAILDVINNKIITNWYNWIKKNNSFIDAGSKYSEFKMFVNRSDNYKSINFDPLNKVYKDSLIDKFIMTVKFKESLWEYWYKCF